MTDIKALDAAATLLPCPFCGGEASLRTYETESLWSHDIVTYTQVGCCECDFHIASEPGFEIEAPACWNTRAKMAPADGAAVEALGEALHGLSAMLLLNRALEDDKVHAAYEKVVARFAALAAMGEG